MEQAPLAGVRIVAVEQFGAGPFGTLHLADLGADIIRLEDPSTGGDVSRYVAPGQRGTDSLYFDSFNRGKRSMLLDLKSPAGQEVLHELCRHAHAVYANLRGDVLKNLGLTYDVLGRINPAIVCDVVLALDIADRGYVLENGHIVMSGRAADLRRDPAVRKAYLGV
jgi:crotonobetainyl-CoA:carnitine CoA-transferase CaiB-like acyl-CoA transferase